METKVRVMCIYKPKNDKNCLQQLEAGERYGINSLQEPPEGTIPVDNFISDFWLSEL